MSELEKLEAKLSALEEQNRMVVEGINEIKKYIVQERYRVNKEKFDKYDKLLSESDLEYLMNAKDVSQADYEINNLLARLRKQGLDANLMDLSEYVNYKKNGMNLETVNDFSNDSTNEEVVKEDAISNSGDLFAELDNINNEFKNALDNDTPISEINSKRNDVLDNINKDNVNKPNYPTIESDDMSRIFETYKVAEESNKFLNEMTFKYGVSKSVLFDMYKSGMLNKNINNEVSDQEQVSGNTLKFPEGMNSANLNVVPAKSVVNSYPLTVDEMRENGGLEPDKGRKTVKMISKGKELLKKAINFVKSKFMSKKNNLDTELANEDISINPTDFREADQVKADYSNELEMNQEPEMTKISVR